MTDRVPPRALRAGERAVLVECGSLSEALALQARLTAALDPAVDPAVDPTVASSSAMVDDVVLGARTVLVIAQSARHLPRVRDAVVRAISSDAYADPESGAAATADAETIEIEVDYSGADLDDVARLTGLTVAGVVAAHTGTPWRVGFAGFAPGFAYLVGGDPRLRVPRRASARVSVPAGSVALADEFSGIYPRSSPGGWQLLGRTDANLWDLTRDPPALLAPGRLVRFVSRDVADHAPTTDLATPPSARIAASARAPYALLEVLTSARPALVQDGGRPGLAGLGVGPSGAADQAAYRLGARLLGQGPECAALEVVLGELSIRARGSVTVALTGAEVAADVDGHPQGHAAPFLLGDGQVLRLGRPALGLRTYLSVRGGLAVDPVLGSRSRDTLSGIGPEPVVAGTVLPVDWASGQPSVDVAPVAPLPRDLLRLRGTWGPRQDRLVDAAVLQSTTWRVSHDSDRVGIRLEPVEADPTALLELAMEAELPPEGLVRGAIQVPPSGRPVVFLSDHPVTGGYPVVAVLDEASVDLAAQAVPGQQVRLVLS
ncbi:carboxyltransferase domain-containing protein [Nostocoides sp. HKS02]|uniref:5-oxoprolinase subunit B/C family protein n=1 Tax=Nostocoides sp. HKS02 TaxID=1813880 RepID=UPI0012B5005C|nr:carboxyltransferase domain-containing protein [Tetrasphaera sp. HKS02]QGN56749.1 carboxyltransferase domain-containing protein [Tetrasphaera sp. HKS02]